MAISSGAAALAVATLPSSAPSSFPRFSVSFSLARPSPSWKKTHETKARTALRASPTGSLGSLRDWGRGTSVLERPNLDQSQFDPIPQPEEGGDMGKVWDKVSLGNGGSYRVLLIDDAHHSENLVEKALPQAVPSVTIGDARKLFHESRQKGVAVVIVAVQEHAEFYAQMMVRRGLRSAIEPDSSVA